MDTWVRLVPVSLHRGRSSLGAVVGLGGGPVISLHLTCSSRRVAAALADQGRTKNQGVTTTLSASGERHPGSSPGHRAQASVSSPAPAAGFFSLRLTRNPSAATVANPSCSLLLD